MKLNSLFVLLFSMFLSSCGDYQKVLKSNDPSFKLLKAKEYFELEQYNKALPIFDELMSSYRGTTKAQDVYKYYALTLYGQKDYILAGYHMKRFSNTFPNNEFSEEAAYLAAYCFYLEAPSSSLDPAYIYKAIDELQLFMNSFPRSSHSMECNSLIDDLRERLEKKYFDIAKGYFHRENYSSAVTSFNVMLGEYPDTKYREEALVLRFKSAYNLASNSVVTLQKDRYKEAYISYLELQDAFPESKFLKELEPKFRYAKSNSEEDILN